LIYFDTSVLAAYFTPEERSVELVKVIRIGPAHSNCVDDQQFFQVPGVGQFEVHAGYVEETGHYTYVDLGTLTVVP